MQKSLLILLLCLVRMQLTSSGKEKELLYCNKYKNCKTCNKDEQCHFIVWKSKEKKFEPVTKCLNIRLSEVDIRTQGPFGKSDFDHHWFLDSHWAKTDCKLYNLKNRNVASINFDSRK